MPPINKVVMASALAFILTLGVPAARAGDASPAYSKDALTKIMARVVYPKMAKLRNQEGVVGLAVTVDATGGVASVAVEQSSGIQSLDEAAMQAAKEAAPFGPAEAGTVIHGAVKFSLNG